MSKDIQIWQEFCNTYDVNLLNKLSKNSQQILQDLIKNTHVKFLGLSKIIDNYYKYHIKKVFRLHPKYIRDVRSLTEHYSHKYNKHIYVFGESHGSEGKCPTSSLNVSDFILNELSKSIKFIDFYLERDFLTKDMLKAQIKKFKKFKGIKHHKISRPKSQLIKLYFSLENCFLKTGCTYPNVRTHYTNIRRVDTGFIYVLHRIIKTVLSNSITPSKRKDLLARYLRELESYPHDLKEYKQIKSIDDLKNFMYPRFVEALQKQVAKINTDELRKDILNQLDLCLSQIDIKDFTYENIKYMIKADIGAMRAYAIRLLRPFSCFMDLYLISRIFREFSHTPYQNSNPPQNIIIYVGDNHAKEYRLLFDRLGFEQRFNIYEKNETYCIDISKLKLPLFS